MHPFTILVNTVALIVLHFFFVTDINMLLSEQTFTRFEIESCFFFFRSHCVLISIQIIY